MRHGATKKVGVAITGETKKARNYLVGALTILGFSAIFMAVYLYKLCYLTYPTKNIPERVIIEKGLSFNHIVDLLAENGIVKNPSLFRLICSSMGVVNQLKAGEYRFSSHMSMIDVIRVLKTGSLIIESITIPEGFTVREIAQLLENTGLASRKEFDEACVNAMSTLHSRGIIPANIEGFLFPDTYYFHKGMPCKKIVSTMLDRFFQVFEDIPWTEPKQTFSKNEVLKVVTLASLVQKEMGVPDEASHISAVFYNRLARRMKLQCDPTVIYAMEYFDGNIRKKDLHIDSPYNTYKVYGLPPGPICNPGKVALSAALNPAPVKYLYFVSRNDGTHKFSKNLTEHNLAVRRYQRVQRKRNLRR